MPLCKGQTPISPPSVTKIIQIGSCPWYSRPQQIDWTIKNHLRAGCNRLIANRHFAGLVQQKYLNHHRIYTGGSVQNGFTSYGIYSSIDNGTIRLRDHTSIFNEEAIALLIAANEGLRRRNVIFTDSASVLQALESETTRDSNIQKLYNIPNSHQVTFCWIPDHTGIQGYEIADRLANAGRNNPACYHNTLPRRDYICLSKTIIANFLSL